MVTTNPDIPAVACKGIIKTFSQGTTDVQALRGVDLEVLLGEITLLVGPSGCGKTTLLSVIAGILDPTAGELHVLGKDFHDMSPEQQIHFRGREIGFVFQQYNLIPSLTAVENAAIPLIIAEEPRPSALSKSRQLLEGMGLGKRLNSPINRLSGGERQRVAIARALVHAPRLLVCDEPTSALDGNTGHLIMELIKKYALSPDRAVIVVTHDTRLFEFGDRIAHMEDGHIIRLQATNPAQP